MKYAAVIIILLSVVGASVGVAVAQNTPQQQRIPAVVSVALTTAAVRDRHATRTDVLLVWNRNERSTPIGHAIKSCLKIGQGGILGGGLLNCSLVLSLPLGKVTASGIVHNLNRYTLVITGGTGTYEGVTGPLFVTRIADGVRRLTFKL